MNLEAAGALGAALLGAATVPQFVQLVRERKVDGLSGWFVGLNAVGLLLLTLRSFQVGEPSFAAINILTAAFWSWAAWLKLRRRLASPGPRTHHTATAMTEL